MSMEKKPSARCPSDAGRSISALSMQPAEGREPTLAAALAPASPERHPQRPRGRSRGV